MTDHAPAFTIGSPCLPRGSLTVTSVVSACYDAVGRPIRPEEGTPVARADVTVAYAYDPEAIQRADEDFANGRSRTPDEILADMTRQGKELT